MPFLPDQKHDSTIRNPIYNTEPYRQKKRSRWPIHRRSNIGNRTQLSTAPSEYMQGLILYQMSSFCAICTYQFKTVWAMAPTFMIAIAVATHPITAEVATNWLVATMPMIS